MELLLNSIIAAGQNILVFFFIPFVWWLIRYRKKENFFKFVGLSKPRIKTSIWSVAVFAIIYIVVYKIDVLDFFVDEASAQVVVASDAIQGSELYGVGMAALLPAFFTNVVGNGLCEEVLFRGFILQRFKKKMGIWMAIILQGVLFGAMHNVLFILGGISVTPLFHVGLLISTSLPGILCGILNEKVFDGTSTVPSILLHGLNNYWGSIRTAFML